MKWFLTILSIVGVALYMSFKNLKINFFNDYFTTDYDFNKYDALFMKSALNNGLSAKWLKAIAANESVIGYNGKVDPVGETKGIMHIKFTTAQDFFPNLTADKLRRPEIEIEAAARYLKFLLNLFGGNLEHAIKAYNAGQGRMKQILKNPNNPDVQTALANVSSYWARFNRNLNRLGANHEIA